MASGSPIGQASPWLWDPWGQRPRLYLQVCSRFLVDADGTNKQQPCSAKTPEATFSVTWHTAFQLQWGSNPGYQEPNDHSEEKGTWYKPSPPTSLSSHVPLLLLFGPLGPWSTSPACRAQRAAGTCSRWDSWWVAGLEPRTPVSHPQAHVFESYLLAKIRINHRPSEEDLSILSK